MSELREPLHQPPNPEDLRRVPPANATCARMRGLLRDFVDGDLGRDLRVDVEEHVHCCRVCAVELSRAEHERLMVCRAFAALGHDQPSLSPGFSDRVVQRLLDETSIEVARDAAGAPRNPTAKPIGTPASKPPAYQPAYQPIDARSQTSGRPNRETGRDRRAWLEAGPHTLLVAGLLVLLCAGVVFSWSIVGDREPEHSARLVVTEATGASGVAGRQLREGDVLSDFQSMWVDAGGAARLEWHDVSSLRQPAATLDVGGGGEVRLQNGAPLLVNGKIGVVTSRPVEIPMGDGSSVRLGVGEYVIAAEVPSDWLHGRDPAPSSPFELHVEVEVLRGHQAEIKRSKMESAFVAAGTIGIYQSNSTVNFRPGGGGVASAQGTVPERSPPLEASPNQTNFGGMVLDRLGQPTEGAAVGLSFTSDGMQRYLTLVSEADGRFSAATDSGCDRPFAIVQVEPAAGRMDLGVTPPQAMPVIRLQSNVQLAPLVLNLSAPLRGSVRDDLDVLRDNVQVLPCIVDELFGSVLPLMSGKTTTDDAGVFQIQRLPSRLPPHQHLAVLLLDSQLEATFVPVPERGSDLGPGWWAPVSMVAKRLHPVQLRELPDDTQVEVLEEVPGLPAESAVVKRVATTNSNGRVYNFMKGSGRLWWRRGTIAAPTVKELVLLDSSSTPRYHPSGSTQPRSNLFRPMADIAGTDVQLVQSWRHQHLAAVNAGSSNGEGQSLFVVDGLGHNVAEAQVFSLAASGPRGSVNTEFHGFTSPAGVFPLAGVAPGTQLLVIGPDGAAGQITLGSGVGAMVPVTLAATGRVQLAENLRPTGGDAGGILTLRFEFLGPSTAGMHPVAVRFASAARGWEFGGLSAGEYRTMIGGTVHQVEVPAGGFQTLH